MQVRIKRDVAARYEIEPAAIAETLQQAMQGDAATEFVVVVYTSSNKRVDWFHWCNVPGAACL